MDVIFDLDDTILCFEAEEKVALEKTLTHFNIPYTNQNLTLYHEINGALWAQIGYGGVTRDQIRSKRFKQFKAALGIDFNAVEVEAYYEKSLAEGYAFMPKMPITLDKLVKNHRVYLATNGITDIQTHRLKNADLYKYFSGLFISELIGYEKPKCEYFDYIKAHIDGFDARNSIMIGDSLKSDILGANDAGIRSCWFNPHHKPNDTEIIPTYEIDDYDQLFAIIDKIQA